MAHVRKRVVAIAVSITLLALAAPAAATAALAGGQGFGPPTTQAEKPGPSLRPMDFLVGAWRCTGRDSTPEGTSYPVVADARIAWTADRSWLRFELAEQRTAANPEPLSGVWLWGYEPAKKRFSAFFFDSLGNRTEQYAPAWSGDTLQLEGRIVGPGFEAPYRDVVVRRSDSFTVTGQGYMMTEWITFQVLDCRR